MEYRLSNVNSNTLVKYYHADGQRIAMREGSSTLYFFVSDHLGSTALTLNQNGTVYSETRYKPFGETAWSSAPAPTRRRYTGQLQDFDLPTMQLYFYNARYYDPALARFTQADTIVPQPANPQSFNRYSYVLNNPLIYTDPSGHTSCAAGDDACWQAEYNAQYEYYRSHGYDLFGDVWKFTGNFHNVWVADDTIRRTMLLEFANHLAANGTAAGEAMAQITGYAASFYESVDPLGILLTGSFIDDVAHVLTGMAGIDIVIDYRSEEYESNPLFLGMHKFPDTDLWGVYRDGTTNQAYHFWFFVAVSYHNSAAVATAGNLYHETIPGEVERSFQDFALSVAATDLGAKLALRQMNFHAVSNWIRSNLMEWEW